MLAFRSLPKNVGASPQHLAAVLRRSGAWSRARAAHNPGRPDARFGIALAWLSGRPVRARQIHGSRRLYPDRQQWLADLDHFAAIPAELRPQSRSDPEGRALWPRVCVVDDQVAWLWRP